MCRENQNTVGIFSENRTVHEITQKNVLEPDTPQMSIWRIRFASWIPKETNTHSEHVVLLLFHCNNGYTKTPECCVVRSLPVWSTFRFFKLWMRTSKQWFA